MIIFIQNIYHIRPSQVKQTIDLLDETKKQEHLESTHLQQGQTPL